MKFSVAIPCNLNSSRLKKKLLIEVKGTTIIQRVINSAIESKISKNIYIVSDSRYLLNKIKKSKNKKLINNRKHSNATSRLTEVASKFKDNYIILLFADEIFLNKKYLRSFVNKIKKLKLKENVVYQATCKTLTNKEIRSKNVVKCLVNSYNYIFDYKRKLKKIDNKFRLTKSIGLFCFSKKTLFLLKKNLEHERFKKESIEQLNILKNKIAIKSIELDFNMPSINDKNDLNFAKSYFFKNENF